MAMAFVHQQIASAAYPNEPSRFARVYWTIWCVWTAGSFLTYEIYALCTRWQNTLSAYVWWLERFQPGQPLTSWAAFHFLLIGVLLLADVWLLGHFGWGLWRG